MNDALFETPIGKCGIAWEDGRIVAIHLPERTDALTLARLRERVGSEPAEPPDWVREATALIAKSVAGEQVELSNLALAMDEVSPFFRRVYELAREIPPGATKTYGELAKLAGSPGASRAVGQAMARNPWPLVVPCHRVLASDGKLTGFSAAGGVDTKARLLASERGARVPEQRSLFLGDAPLPFDRVQSVNHLRDADAKLAKVIDRIGPLRLQLESMHGPYEALATAIVHQQLNGKAARTIEARVKAAFGGDAWPAPERLLDADDLLLRGAGLSAGKMAALRDLAAKTLDGTVPDLPTLAGLEDDAIVERLTVVRGIGRWTVEMMLIFRLGRPDVLPIDDFGIRKGFGRIYKRGEMPAPRDVAKFGERWRPFRSVASWYLWRACELA